MIKQQLHFRGHGRFIHFFECWVSEGILIIMNFTNVAFSYIVQIITTECIHHRTRNYLCFIDIGENQLPVYNWNLIYVKMKRKIESKILSIYTPLINPYGDSIIIKGKLRFIFLYQCINFDYRMKKKLDDSVSFYYLWESFCKFQFWNAW